MAQLDCQREADYEENKKRLSKHYSDLFNFIFAAAATAARCRLLFFLAPTQISRKLRKAQSE